MGRHVITLDAENFAITCDQLQTQIVASGFVPDIVVGIRTGGAYVADNVFPDTPHTYTLLQRLSTRRKANHYGRLLRSLPRFLADTLRIAESFLLSLRRPKPIAADVVDVPDLSGRRSILIVDDAVDSGVTLDAVYRAVAAAYPEADVRTATITVTTRSPLKMPDVYLYNDYTLIRFPWSLDA